MASHPGQSVRDLWPLLLLWAALLFPLDIAVRRLALPVSELWATVLARRRRRPAPAPATVDMARLQQAKRQASPPVAPIHRESEPPVVAPVSQERHAPPAPASAPLSTTQRLLDMLTFPAINPCLP